MPRAAGGQAEPSPQPGGLTQGPGTGDTWAPSPHVGRTRGGHSPEQRGPQPTGQRALGQLLSFPGAAPHVGNACPSLSGLVAGALLLERGLRPCWELDCHPNSYIEAQSPQNGTGDN